jgi:hypothetical protein
MLQLDEWIVLFGLGWRGLSSGRRRFRNWETRTESSPFLARMGLVGVEAMEEVMGVLPDGFHHDSWGVGGYFEKDLHAVVLGVDEAEFADGGHDGLFGLGLGGPADAIGGQTQVAVRNKENGMRHSNLILITDGMM